MSNLTEMLLVQVGNNPLNGLTQVAPNEKRDLNVFMHCTGGAIAVTLDAYFDNFMQVFEAHGVKIMFETEFVLSEDFRKASRGGK